MVSLLIRASAKEQSHQNRTTNQCKGETEDRTDLPK